MSKLLVNLIVASSFLSLAYTGWQSSPSQSPHSYVNPSVVSSQSSHLAITCPPGIVLYANANCEAEVIIETPTSTCNITSMSFTSPGNPPTVVTPGPSGYPSTLNLGFFGVDTFDIVFQVTDDCVPPTIAQCTLTVFIQDTISPTITCPMDVVAGNNEDGRRNTMVLVGQPTTDDNCGIAQIVNSFNGTDDASGDYPLGTTKVTWTVTDIYGNTASCCMSVTVFDNTPPEITCPPTINVECEAPPAYANYLAFEAAGGNAEDETLLDTLSFMLLDEVSDGMNCPETITRRYVIQDTTGNADTCTQLIIILDITPPNAQCQDVTVYLDATGAAILTTADLNNNSTDNCNEPLAYSTNINLLFGCNDVSGPIDIILTVTDACSNSASCVSTVTVLDTIRPTILNCAPDITVQTDMGLCTASNVNLGTPSATDNCLFGGIIYTPTLNGTNVSNTTLFPEGTNTVIWIVTDVNNNTSTCSQTVTVTDNQPPTITCPGVLTINNNVGQCFATNITPLIAQTNDNCGVDNVSVSYNNAPLVSSTQINVGTHTLVYTVTDINGLTASCTSTLVVADIEPPTITCPANVTFSTDNGICASTNISLLPPSVDDNCGVQSVLATFNNTIVNLSTIFPVGSNTVIHTVTDIHGNSSSCTQIVTIVDNQSPTITCPVNLTVGLNDDCDITLPDLTTLPVVNDNCGVQTVTQMPIPGTIITSMHDMVHTITFIVTDQSGLTASCSTSYTAKDVLGPDIDCKDLTVVSISATPEVAAIDLVDTAEDACGGPLRYEVRRMGNDCTTGQPDDFGPYVSVCCADVNDTITVVVRVYDQYNNFTECMTRITVQDKLAPRIISGLPDITISCSFEIDTSDLDTFGKFVFLGTLTDSIIIVDVNNPFYPDSLAGFDGVYDDNCPNVDVDIIVTNRLTMCNTGIITREFIFTDEGDNVTTYTQTITVVDVDPFDESDIQWPVANVDYYYCNDILPNPDSTGRPVFNNDRCSRAAATFKDQTFDHPLYCTYVRRTWTVVDWCQYETNIPSSGGKYSFVQNIFVKDTIKPEIAPIHCQNITVCTGNGCTGVVALTASGSDNCLNSAIHISYRMDLNSDGSIDLSGNGQTFNGIIDIGHHTFFWIVSDGCGNMSSCQFTVDVKDCKAPTAIAKNGLAANLPIPMAMTTVWAKEFDNLSFDNCTPKSGLKFSFSQDTSVTSLTYDCDSIGRRQVTLWVTDQAGNQSYANTYIDIQDNNGLCDNSTTGGRIHISGAVQTENNIMLDKTGIKLESPVSTYFHVTDSLGYFDFADLEMYQDYNINPIKDGKPLEGVSTLDLVLIQRHILDIQKLNSPYKLIAADVNNSQSITAADIVELRKMILGAQANFTNNKSWRFIDADIQFVDIQYPWPFNENKSYFSLDQDMLDVNFIGIKTGDVDGSIEESLTSHVQTQKRSDDNILLQVDDTYLTPGQIHNVAIYASSLDEIIAMQGTISFADGVEILSVESELMTDDEWYNASDENAAQAISFAVARVDPKSWDNDRPFMEIKLLSQNAALTSHLLQLNNSLTSIHAYNTSLYRQNIVIEFRNNNQKDKNNALDSKGILQNHPNPFSDFTIVPFHLHENQIVMYKIFDIQGRLVHSQEKFLNKGYNELQLSDTEFSGQKGTFSISMHINNAQYTFRALRF